MTSAEAIHLVRGGVTRRGVWADLGAGTGTFTRALAELLGSESVVYAVDRQPRLAATPTGVELVGAEPAGSEPVGAKVRSVRADFTRPLELGALDGVLMANSLHFVRQQERVLRRVVGDLVPDGVFLLVEYDLQRPTPWLPFPVPPARFADLARRVGLGEPRVLARQPSRYGPRDLYAAVAVAGPAG